MGIKQWSGIKFFGHTRALPMKVASDTIKTQKSFSVKFQVTATLTVMVTIVHLCPLIEIRGHSFEIIIILSGPIAITTNIRA